MFLNGSLNSAKSGGKWLKQAPMWTSASGIFYKRDFWSLSLIDKVGGPAIFRQYRHDPSTSWAPIM